MFLKLYKMNKRINSTKVPTAEDLLISGEVVLKMATSVDKPIFTMACGADDMAKARICNYAEFQGNFFWITDARQISNSHIEYTCEIDVLASYKAEILASKQFVVYANKTNTEISDKRIPTKTKTVINTNTASFDTLGSGGYTIVLSITGKNSTTTFAMEESTAIDLLNSINEWYENDTEIPFPSDNLLGEVAQNTRYIAESLYYMVRQLIATGKASDSIKSAYAIPIPLSNFGGTRTRVYLGQYDTKIDAIKVTDRVYSDGVEILIPWQATDWRRNSPYHEIYLEIPYVGLINISPSEVMGINLLHVSALVDKSNGDAIFTVWGNGSAHIIGQYTANIGSTYAIGASNVTARQSATSLATAAGGVAALIGGVTGFGAVAAATSVGLGLANSIDGQPTTISSNGGGAALGLNGRCSCYTVFHDTIVSPHECTDIVGEPLSSTVELNKLTGYVQTQNASVSCIAMPEEIERINSFLNGGVYIE